MTKLERYNKIESLLDKDYLDKLVELAKLYGWDGDYTEVRDFVETLFELYHSDCPDLTPYTYED